MSGQRLHMCCYCGVNCSIEGSVGDVAQIYSCLEGYPIARIFIVQLNVYPGLKGLKEMLGAVPAWIHYEERERVEVTAQCQPAL